MPFSQFLPNPCLPITFKRKIVALVTSKKSLILLAIISLTYVLYNQDVIEIRIKKHNRTDHDDFDNYSGVWSDVIKPEVKDYFSEEYLGGFGKKMKKIFG